MSSRKEGDVLSPGELQAELNSLRTLRRRSLSTNSDGRLDPDLPGQSLTASPVSPRSPSPNSPAHRAGTSSESHGGGASSIPDSSSSSDADEDKNAPLSGQVDSLFWLPAHLHPGIAPQQFKEFIKEQTTPEALARRSASVSRSSSLRSGSSSTMSRRKSTLSRQIDPAEADSGDVLHKPPQRADTTSARLRRRGTQLDKLTLSDLHKLEELSRAARSGAPEGEEQLMQNILERSLSSSLYESNREGDSPLNLPAPGSILRRSAISKVRKPSLLGDGGGHRFGPSRRTTRRASDHASDRLAGEPPTSSSSSLSDQDTSPSSALPTMTTGTNLTTSPIMEDGTALPSTSDSPHGGEQQQPSLRVDTASLGVASDRPVPEHKRSASDDSFLDAYINQSPVDNRSSWPSASSPASPPDSVAVEDSAPKQWPSENLSVADSYARSQDSSAASTLAPVPISSSYAPQQAPTAAPIHAPSPPQPQAPAPAPDAAKPPPPPAKEKPEKEKKSTWARLGLSRVASSIRDDGGDSDDAASATSSASHSSSKKKDKRNKKASAAADKEAAEEGKDKEGGGGSSGFFGGLFSSSGSSSKKRHESAEPPVHQQIVLPTSSGCYRDGDFVNFYRLPIHVERAVYRLSHLKLANPKRALYEQVLISNLMFWYLSAMNQPKPPNQPMTSGEMSDLIDLQPGRGAPNPVGPLDLPQPDTTQQPKGPPGASQPMDSPLSSYPPAASGSNPAKAAEASSATSSATPPVTASSSRAPREQQPIGPSHPNANPPPESHRPPNKPQDSFKVVRGNSSSGRDARSQQSHAQSSSSSHEPHQSPADFLATHRKHQGRDVPWEREQSRQLQPSEHHSANTSEGSHPRPRRDASLQQQQQQPNNSDLSSKSRRTPPPPVGKSDDYQHGRSTTREGHPRQEHIVV